MNLAILQQRFQQWLETGNLDHVAGFATESGPGFAVYLNNYRTQLMNCLEDAFPYTMAWLGETLFRAVARQHIMTCVPTAWTLDAYPATLVAALATLIPDDLVAAELAGLELAISEAVTAADRVPLTRPMLATLDWEVVSLSHGAGVKVLWHYSNAARIWSALSRGEEAPSAQCLSEATAILVWRIDWTPCFRALDPDEAVMFSAMENGVLFSEICTSLSQRLGHEAAIQRAGLLLARWTDDCVVSVSGSCP